ncbi:hypothetical protein ACP70R_033254 [Stipagrostis hirtigluma subsp. patula]
MATAEGGGCGREDRLGCFLDRAGADGRRCDRGAGVLHARLLHPR